MEACRKGATVTAVDINPEAVLTTRENFAANFTGLQNVEVVVSDLFENIRARLLDLKKANISMAKYNAVISEVLENETTYIKSESFYQEINEVIGEELNPSQLILLK